MKTKLLRVLQWLLVLHLYPLLMLVPTLLATNGELTMGVFITTYLCGWVINALVGADIYLLSGGWWAKYGVGPMPDGTFVSDDEYRKMTEHLRKDSPPKQSAPKGWSPPFFGPY